MKIPQCLYLAFEFAFINLTNLFIFRKLKVKLEAKLVARAKREDDMKMKIEN